MRRRRSRQAAPRPRAVQFSLSEEEFAEVSEAAARSGLARGAFAAEAALGAFASIGFGWCSWGRHDLHP